MNTPTFSDTAGPILDGFRRCPLLRVVNYHSAAKSRTEHFDRELEQYSKSFSSVNEQELRDYVRTGHWSKSKPGMIPVAYEGYRNGFDVLAPLLERHGFVGWFFIITSFVNTPVAEQLAYARSHRIGMKTEEYPDGRYALSWEEIKKLDAKHVIASHARSHVELAPMTSEMMEREVMGSQEDMRQHLGHPVRTFASLRGPAHGPYPATDRLVEAAGYEFVFSNYRIQRVGDGGRRAG